VKSLKPYGQLQLNQAKTKLSSVYPAQVSERIKASNKKRVSSAALPLKKKGSKQRPMTAQQKQLQLQ